MTNSAVPDSAVPDSAVPDSAVALRGLTTISFWADDLEAAELWYTEVLGIEPYFRMDGYIEFRIGDYLHELGIIDARYGPPGGPAAPGGAVVYWAVDDLDSTLSVLLEKGATEYQPVTNRSQGFVTAAVVDPFGNILGVMTNPHYLEVLAGRS